MTSFGECWTCDYRKSAAPEFCYTCFREEVELLEGAEVCGYCAHPLGWGDVCRNPLCRSLKHDRQFAWNRSLGRDIDLLRAFVRAYKFEDSPNWRASILGRLLAKYLLLNEETFRHFDVIIPSPTYVDPKGRRSWDHIAFMLGKVAGHLSDWPIVPDDRCIGKRYETPSMVKEGKTSARRHEIALCLAGALVIPDPDAVFDKRVLVVDDLFTGGNTLNEVARALRTAGARRVCSLTIARRIYQPRPE